MKTQIRTLAVSIIAVLSLFNSGCSSEEKPSDKLLSDYKKQQLDKAKQVEEEMNKRVDNLDQQLKSLEEKPADEPDK